MAAGPLLQARRPMLIPTHSSQETPPLSGPPDLVLVNARVLTLEPEQPRAEAVAIRGQTIVAVGPGADVTQLAGPGTHTIDCQGMCMLPGFIDAHCHLLATASSLQGLACGPGSVPNIQCLQDAIRHRAGETPPGKWIRGFGYDELALKERRHPTRWDLDLASPNHPVRLDHRTGHATVLNSQGLRLAGIQRDTPDPVEGVIERDEQSGEPTGLLLEMGSFLGERLGRLRANTETKERVLRLNRMLLGYGITSVQDAGHGNGLSRWDAFHSLQSSGRLQCRVTMLVGAAHLGDFLDEGRNWGDGNQWLRLGHVKTMLSLTTGALQPNIEELRQIVEVAHQSGFPVALHAIEQEAVSAAAQVIQEMPLNSPLKKGGGRKLTEEAGSIPKDRLEHCAECPPELAASVRRSMAMVVTQPGFLFWNGDSYRERVDPTLLSSLYPVGELASCGVTVAFGSDSPVIDPNPWPAIYSAVTRFTKARQRIPRYGGNPQSMDQSVSIESALRMYSIAGAYAEGTQNIKGTIRPGKLADLVLVDKDPTAVDPATLKDIQPILTLLGGQVVWEAGSC